MARRVARVPEASSDLKKRGEGALIGMRVRGKDGWRRDESRSPAFYGPEEVKRRSVNSSWPQPHSKKGKLRMDP